MKIKITLYLLTAFFSLRCWAQPLPVGSTVGDISLTDIKGNAISLYSYLEEGYTVLIDLSATWCGPCWSFENTGIGQSIYEHYGPTGTVKPKKMMFLFIEGDPRTNANDLKGTGNNTQGDWITAKSYPIVDAGDWNIATHFLVPGAKNINFPTFLLICPDKKVIWNSEGFKANQDEEFLVAQMGSCTANSTSITRGSVLTSVSVYPNPASDVLHVDLDQSATTSVTVRISNIVGQTFIQQPFQVFPGMQALSLETRNLPKGIYVVTLESADGSYTQQKFVKD